MCICGQSVWDLMIFIYLSYKSTNVKYFQLLKDLKIVTVFTFGYKLSSVICVRVHNTQYLETGLVVWNEAIWPLNTCITTVYDKVFFFQKDLYSYWKLQL